MITLKFKSWQTSSRTAYNAKYAQQVALLILKPFSLLNFKRQTLKQLQ